jgi:prepilin-type N-terminal cleavage/methylation domain-containing protein
MFKEWQQRKSDGFTLIELLVVIAIIGILAALLFPAITGALTKAKAVKVGNNGRNIHLAIFSENVDRESIDLPWVFPLINPPASDYEPDFIAACANSTEYLRYLVKSGILEGVTTAMFAAPGIVAQPDTEAFAAANNAWNVVAGLNEKAAAATPFLFTKNFNLTGDLSTLDETNPLLDIAGMPFGGKLGIVVTKGGAVKILALKYLIDITGASTRFGKELFNPAVTVSTAGVPQLYPEGLPWGFLTPEGTVAGTYPAP